MKPFRSNALELRDRPMSRHLSHRGSGKGQISPLAEFARRVTERIETVLCRTLLDLPRRGKVEQQSATIGQLLDPDVKQGQRTDLTVPGMEQLARTSLSPRTAVLGEPFV